MDNKNHTITHAYHFISESIVIFLLLLPIVFHHYEGIPYWIYLCVIAGLSVVYSLFAHYKWNQIPYILMTPVVFLVFYVIGYPIGLCLFFTCVLTWRYIAIRSERYVRRENFYLITSIILASGIMLFIQDAPALMFVFVLLTILVVGNIGSHAAVIKKDDQRAFNRSFWSTFVGLLLVLSVTIYLLSDFVRTLFITSYEAITTGFINLTKTTFSFMPDVDLGHFVEYRDAPDATDTQMEESNLGESIFTEVSIAGLVYLGLTALFICFGIFMIVSVFRTRFRFKEEEQEENNEYQRSEKKLGYKNPVKKKIVRKRLRRIEHPVRRMVYRFEHLAAKQQQGRLPSETIEEWLQRINFPSDFSVYQKVRYGNAEVSEQEILELTEEIEQMKIKLKGLMKK